MELAEVAPLVAVRVARVEARARVVVARRGVEQDLGVRPTALEAGRQAVVAPELAVGEAPAVARATSMPVPRRVPTAVPRPVPTAVPAPGRLADRMAGPRIVPLDPLVAARLEGAPVPVGLRARPATTATIVSVEARGGSRVRQVRGGRVRRVPAATAHGALLVLVASEAASEVVSIVDRVSAQSQTVTVVARVPAPTGMASAVARVRAEIRTPPTVRGRVAAARVEAGRVEIVTRGLLAAIVMRVAAVTPAVVARTVLHRVASSGPAARPSSVPMRFAPSEASGPSGLSVLLRLRG